MKESKHHKCARLIFRIREIRLRRSLTRSEDIRVSRLEAWMKQEPLWKPEESEVFKRAIEEAGLEWLEIPA